MITVERFGRIFPGCKDHVGWAQALEAGRIAAAIQSPRECQLWLAHMAHESTYLTALVESLNYSSARLREMWPRRFKTDAAALPYARNPKKLALYLYGDLKAQELGNRPGTQDGWTYRGHGPFQLTGRGNYQRFAAWLAKEHPQTTGNVLDDPSLLTLPVHGALSAAWYWLDREVGLRVNSRTPDHEVVVATTRAINGGLNGLAERKKAFADIQGDWDR